MHHSCSDAQGEVALYGCKTRDDARKIDGLEKERMEHMATIAALEAQLQAARQQAAVAPASGGAFPLTDAEVRYCGMFLSMNAYGLGYR